ncbi:hypothetical protein AALC75_17985 [Lachnospiraceae bacterium 48-42]
MNNGMTSDEASFPFIVFVFWCSLFLYMELLEVCFIFFRLIFRERVMAFLAVYIMCLIENYFIRFPVIFGRAGAGYERWVNRDFRILQTMMILVVFIELCGVLADRKDYINVE